ncbi:MAG TPA: hypothetical protein VK982_02065 [Bacteroidales bacterium]|nr:hypothetical protein [Bacteroidales bacterium]
MYEIDFSHSGKYKKEMELITQTLPIEGDRMLENLGKVAFIVIGAKL